MAWYDYDEKRHEAEEELNAANRKAQRRTTGD